MNLSNIKIPEKHYVGMVRRNRDGLPLGFMTPWGKDAAAAKRMATVDSWAGKGTGSLEPQVISNAPMSGFKLGASIRSSGYGGYDKWRIEDPRGFELEITSGNLAQLISVGMIDQGEIMDQCVWARHGASNVLLSTATAEYKRAVENTEIAGKTANWKDVKIGNGIVLQNGIKGTWLGRMHAITKVYPSPTDTSEGVDMIHVTTAYHVIHVDSAPEGGDYRNYTSQLHMITSPKLSSISDAGSVLTKQAAEAKANELLCDDRCEPVRVGYTNYTTALALAFSIPERGTQLTLVRDPVKPAPGSALEDLHAYGSPMLFVETPDGMIGHVDGHASHLYANWISVPHLELNELRSLMVKASSRYRGIEYEFSRKQYHRSPSDRFFNLLVNINTSEGNGISVPIKA